MLKQEIKCYEEEAKSCDAAILQHFIAYWKAVEKYLAEGQGEFEKMAERIMNSRMVTAWRVKVT